MHTLRLKELVKRGHIFRETETASKARGVLYPAQGLRFAFPRPRPLESRQAVPSPPKQVEVLTVG